MVLEMMKSFDAVLCCGVGGRFNTTQNCGPGRQGASRGRREEQLATGARAGGPGAMARPAARAGSNGLLRERRWAG